MCVIEAAVIRIYVDGAANGVYSHPDISRSEFMPTLVSGDFDSIRPEVLQFYRDKVDINADFIKN